ncbi:XrtA/PEP-CTERM system-associated ATPase [Novosphingobium sp. JCM 18896]|uniref:XrtA/PEP-CTERM system-associated ATPase n=1 Tax=Novosphingobium sp. JCM 18896 TaxID=2989731 RepID=UPI002222CA70|nr:XrtA/PEP-CTERM system-associated ATPase [Novosphingobium sp. JCM 18896]MCW1428151.1 XrtA-associated ATPase [Novosphingobium sp. JCM 18896]
MFDEFYGLSGRPFQLTPDPAFYFESLTHRKALSYLSYGLAQAEGFVVITGEVGAGKSTLVAYLMATIDPARLTAAQIVTSKLDEGEIIHVVAQAFGLPVQGHDKASALGAIESFLHDEARAGRRCLLIVDESQNLSIGALEELRMLSNFQLGAHPLLQTLLLGQPEFRGTLQDHSQLEQLRQRVIATHHLDAMETAEVQAYIEHRLKRVGWEGNPSFDQRVFAEIYTATGGVPRRINQIVNRLLMLGAVDQRSHIDNAMLQQVLGELGRDAASAREQAPAAPQAVPAQASVAEVAPQPIEGVAAAALHAALAERDAQIAELQHAIVELANKIEVPSAQNELAILRDRVAALESQVVEQESAIRHTLTMLIEWIETENGARVAA